MAEGEFVQHGLVGDSAAGLEAPQVDRPPEERVEGCEFVSYDEVTQSSDERRGPPDVYRGDQVYDKATEADASTPPR